MEQEQNNPKARFKKMFNKYFDYRAWSDWKRTKSMTNYFVNVFSRLFIPKKVNPEDAKKFDDLVSEMGLTEDDLKIRMLNFRRMYLAMIGGAFAFYAYAMYQMLYGGVLSVILSLVLSFVSLSLAFRYHFWHFQIKHRKLGCSIQEWFRTSFMGGDQ